jgi:hypothetical protein
MDPLLHPREIDKNLMKAIQSPRTRCKSDPPETFARLKAFTNEEKHNTKKTMVFPTDQWMKAAKSPDVGADFIATCVRSFGVAECAQPRRVVQGVGSGLRLIENAQKWSGPHVGPGAETTKLARGQQWRLVMAYSGLEVMAKSLQGNFTTQDRPGVRRFVSCLGEYGSEAIQLPRCKQSPRGKPPEDLLDFLRAQNSDRKLLERWIVPPYYEEGESGWQRSEAIELARIIRNLTAHGILSATVAIRMNIPELCSSLTNTITETSKLTLIHLLD